MFHDICRLLEKGLSYNDIIDTLDLGNNDYIKSLLIRIRTGKQWKSISQHYKIDTSSKLRRHDDDEIHAICRNFDNGIFSPKKIKDNIGSNQDYQSFKKLVWFIKNRKCYKNISDNYNWWKR